MRSRSGGFLCYAANGVDLLHADLGEAFVHHLVTGGLPFFVVLKQHDTDQAHDGGLVGEDPDDVSIAFDVLVETFGRVGAVRLGEVQTGKGHVGQHVLFAYVHVIG